MGEIINYNSICPVKYKTGVIHTLLHRAYLICSTWEAFSDEIDRLKQLLVNNNFPLYEIDNTINKFLNAKFSNNLQKTTQNNAPSCTSPQERKHSSQRLVANPTDGKVVDQEGNIIGEYTVESERHSDTKQKGSSTFYNDKILSKKDVNEKYDKPNNSLRQTNKSIDISDETPSIVTNTNAEEQQGIKCTEHEEKSTIQVALERPTEMQRKTSEEDNAIKIFYRSQMTSNYKMEEKTLKDTILKNVKPTRDDAKLILQIYYRNYKLQNLFIRNNNNKKEEYNVVYKYTCNKEPCNGNQTYIGCTTTLLKTRLTNHTQQGSIKKHNAQVHHCKTTTQDLVDQTIVLAKVSNRSDLFIAEALLIRVEKPTINEQNEFSERTLRIF